MDVSYYGIECDTAQYPTSRVPLLPVGCRIRRAGSEEPVTACRFSRKDAVLVNNGRSALLVALRDAGIGANDEVVLPAYHCITMVQPVVACGAHASFYRLNRDLSPDLSDLVKRVTGRTKAVVVTHYFGLTQSISTITEWCRSNGILLIEDCAHAMLYRAGSGERPGYVGDYAVASTRKFMPSSDGGAVCANPPRDVDATLDRLTIKEQAQAIVNPFDMALYYGRGNWTRLGYRSIVGLGQFVKTVRSQRATEGGEQCKTVKGGGIRCRPMSWMARNQMCRSDFRSIAGLRRRNYRYIVDRINECDGVGVFSRELRDENVPYMVPVLLEFPGQQFSALKMAGLPMFRWEEMAMTDCPVSTEYRRRLIQIPCHQSLHDEELSWMADTISAVCRRIQKDEEG